MSKFYAVNKHFISSHTVCNTINTNLIILQREKKRKETNVI